MGTVTLKLGVFHGVSEEEYFAIPAVNRSSLDEFEKSAEHYWAKYISSDRIAKRETNPMNLGKGVHASIFERDRFIKEYRVAPTPELFPDALVSADDYKAKCKELELPVSGTKDVLKARILEKNKDVKFFDDVEAHFAKNYKLLSFTEFKAATAIAKKISQSKSAAAVFGKGKSEVVIIWKDPETNIACKARLDWLTDDYTIVTDPKTTRDVRPDAFAKAVGNFGYHRQASWYMDAVEHATGVRPKLFVWLAIEVEFPYAVRFYYASDRSIEVGAAENRKNLNALRDCAETKNFPGYPDELTHLDLPKWYGSTNQLTEREF